MMCRFTAQESDKFIGCFCCVKHHNILPCPSCLWADPLVIVEEYSCPTLGWPLNTRLCNHTAIFPEHKQRAQIAASHLSSFEDWVKK